MSSFIAPATARPRPPAPPPTATITGRSRWWSWMTLATRSPIAWVDAASMRRATSSAGKPQGRAGGRERGARGFLIAARVVARLDEAERVRGAGVGERDRAAVGQTHDQVVGRVARARRAQLGGRAVEVGGGQEARVRQPGDVRAARTDAVDTVAADAQHRAAGDTEHAHVERADRGRVAGDLHVRERGPPAPDRRDVGGRAADLDDHRVLDAARSQRAGHRRRGPGVERARGCAPEAGEVGGAAVAAHDHHRAVDAGGRDARRPRLRRCAARSAGSTR